MKDKEKKVRGLGRAFRLGWKSDTSERGEERLR